MDKMEERAITAMPVIPRDRLPELRAGDVIGLILSKEFPTQVWVRAEVVANDPRDGIVVIEDRHGRLDTLLYDADAMCHWNDEPLRCWCGSFAEVINEATDAADEHAACLRHVKDTGYRELLG